MSIETTLLEKFRSFCYQNRATDFEKAIEYFTVFGDTGWSVDMTIPLDEIIEQKVFANYRYIHGDITKNTQSNPTYHKILSSIAIGDRREHGAFRKAGVGREDGEEAIDTLIAKDILMMDHSVEKPLYETDKSSDKLLFVSPFMRFWFAMISPYYKGIKGGEFTEAKDMWQKRKGEFSNLIYTLLIREYILDTLKDEYEGDPIVSIGSYYDKNTDIDIFAKRKSGLLIAGSCKYTKSKINKSELTSLKNRCKASELNIDTYILFSKNKFSSELKKEKSENLKLLIPRDIASMMDNISSEEMITYDSKKY